MQRIGITTTVPSEVIWASGAVPVDLNNVFITSENRNKFITFAEREGYPRNVCGWIKGIYGVLNYESDITTVVAVTQGDCSNTHALMETLQLKGIRTIPFQAMKITSVWCPRVISTGISKCFRRNFRNS